MLHWTVPLRYLVLTLALGFGALAAFLIALRVRT